MQKIGGKYVLVHGLRTLAEVYKNNEKEIHARLISSGLLTIEEIIKNQENENES